ncbi:hypothetical protein ACFQ6B_03020 [Streptomyces wedmorensis]|uniref:Uncharacterized protein n=1 Tax=Streptomyces wedmorensis TaxID=43759 RepID=A0ABW6J3E0_STRWE
MNTMLAPAPVPTSCGVLDMDRTWWGDPETDWTMRMARAKQDARLAFFDSYGRPEETEAGAWRRHLYEVRHHGGLRLERHRLGNEVGVEDSYGAVAEGLATLAQAPSRLPAGQQVDRDGPACGHLGGRTAASRAGVRPEPRPG